MNRIFSLFSFFCILAAGVLTTSNACVADESGAEKKAPKIIRPITEKYDDAHRGFQCVPTLAVVDNSRLWAAWYAGGQGEGEDNYVLVATSGDGGATWSKPVFAIDPDKPVRAYDEILWRDPTGRLWLFWGQGIMGRTQTMQWAMFCDEPEKGEEAVWSEPRLLCAGLMLSKPIVDSRGRFLYPIQTPDGAAIYVSEDGGETIRFLSLASTPPKELAGADEHNIVEKMDGSLWVYNRLRVPGVGQTCSKDGGKTWTPFEINDWNNAVSRFFIRRLQSGALLLVKHGEMGEYCGRTNLKAFLSKDDGETWIGGLLIEPRFRCSYPDGDQAPDGTIYLTYDRNRGLEREIYCVKITEADVEAGEIVAPESRLRIIINKPTDVFETGWESATRYTKENGRPGEYWETEKVLEAIGEIERGEREPIKNL